LKPKCVELVSNVAFNFNLRRYIMELANVDSRLPIDQLAGCMMAAGAYTRPLFTST
jgi:hypothetical protein